MHLACEFIVNENNKLFEEYSKNSSHTNRSGIYRDGVSVELKSGQNGQLNTVDGTRFIIYKSLYSKHYILFRKEVHLDEESVFASYTFIMKSDNIEGLFESPLN